MRDRGRAPAYNPPAKELEACHGGQMQESLSFGCFSGLALVHVTACLYKYRSTLDQQEEAEMQ